MNIINTLTWAQIIQLYCLNEPYFVGPPRQDAGAAGIDWGDSEAAPIEIEIVDVGTDCKRFALYKRPSQSCSLSHTQLLKCLCHPKGPEGVARGEDALTVLENSQSRSQFIDELMEVKITPEICV